MFESAEDDLKRIIKLVQLCPEKLQERCFEQLLAAYLEQLKTPSKGHSSDDGQHGVEKIQPAADTANGVPNAIKTRFNSLVGRAKVSQVQGARLFDFTIDPFNYHALTVEGDSVREKMRSVALMLCLKEYLTTGSWAADWQEFKTACVDHSCWDQNNATNALNHGWFKSGGKSGIALAPAGISGAEQMFARLSGGPVEG